MNRFDTRTPPTGNRRGSQDSATTPTRPKASRTTPSQKERVRRMLTRDWICGIEFLAPPDGYPPILRYTGRIHELRKEGWLVDRRECSHGLHNHGRGVQMWQWRIVGHVDDGTLPGLG